MLLTTDTPNKDCVECGRQATTWFTAYPEMDADRVYACEQCARDALWFLADGDSLTPVINSGADHPYAAQCLDCGNLTFRKVARGPVCRGTHARTTKGEVVTVGVEPTTATTN